MVILVLGEEDDGDRGGLADEAVGAGRKPFRQAQGVVYHVTGSETIPSKTLYR